ncbi:MAG: isoprenyl transferase [Alphaproteobacteria bacterium]|nr:isoprenyl transferase [Alphaproteobacteria bacterium]
MLEPQTRNQPPELPQHVAIIMDGNGRWAQARGKPRIFGHRQGVEAVRRTVRAAREVGLGYLTLYAFSSENWGRPPEEVEDLMGLLRHYLKSEIAELHESGIRLNVVGNLSLLAPDIRALIEGSMEKTRDNKDMVLTIALSYGARDEIARAARALAEQVSKGQLAPEEITEQALEAELYTHGIPDPDLLIRTSGEQRLSNFMLWQCAYTEFVFMEECWPEFGKELLLKAIQDYYGRERRYGVSGA